MLKHVRLFIEALFRTKSLQIKSQVFIIFSDSSGNMPKKFNILEKKVLKNNNRQEIVN